MPEVGLAIFRLITNQVKRYPFEVKIPAGLSVSGVILADQAKSLDWRARGAELMCSLPPETVVEIRQKLGLLLTS